MPIRWVLVHDPHRRFGPQACCALILIGTARNTRPSATPSPSCDVTSGASKVSSHPGTAATAQNLGGRSITPGPTPCVTPHDGQSRPKRHLTKPALKRCGGMTLLVSDDFWGWSSRFCRVNGRSREAADHGLLIAQPWRRSCSCYEPASSGTRYRPRWAAAARSPAGAWQVASGKWQVASGKWQVASGKWLEFGPGCTGVARAAAGCQRPALALGARRRSTAPACLQKAGCGSRPKPDGPRQARHEVASPHRRQGYGPR
jgi:hypothetical protein